MKTAMKTTTSTPLAATAPPPRYYWILQRESSPELAKLAQVAPSIDYPHSGLTDGQARTAKELMKKLRTKGWKVSGVNNTRSMFARVQITKYGFNVVRFATYAAAVADDEKRAAAAKARRKAALPAAATTPVLFPRFKSAQPAAAINTLLISRLKAAPPTDDPRFRLAQIIVLGAELDHYGSQVIGLSEAEANRYHQCAEAVRLRMRFSGGSGEANALLWALCLPSSERTEKQVSWLIDNIVRLGLTDGDSEDYLVKEYQAVQPPKGSDERQLRANPWPRDDAYELSQKWQRLKPVIEQEAARRAEVRLENERSKQATSAA